MGHFFHFSFLRMGHLLKKVVLKRGGGLGGIVKNTGQLSDFKWQTGTSSADESRLSFGQNLKASHIFVLLLCDLVTVSWSAFWCAGGREPGTVGAGGGRGNGGKRERNSTILPTCTSQNFMLLALSVFGAKQANENSRLGDRLG